MNVKIKFKPEQVVDPSSLKKHPRNFNVHTDEQLDRFMKILKERGWTSPIVVSRQSGFITKGHLRLMAALKMGLKQVPIQYNDYKNETDEFSDLTADNEIARWSTLDQQKIINGVNELEDFDLDLLGIQDDSFFNQMEKQDQEFHEEMQIKEREISENDFNENEFIVDDKPEKTLDNDKTTYEKFVIIIECQNENERGELFQELRSRSINCKLMNG